MNRTFGYNWKQMLQVFFAIPFVFLYIIWKRDNFNESDVVVVFLAVLFVAGKQALPMCRVLLIDTEIHISFLLPLRKGGRFRYDEIESYTELVMQRKGNKFVFGGLLQPKGGKRIMLMSSGTKEFKELNSLLSEVFPKPTKDD
jgi:hypothetical protein